MCLCLTSCALPLMLLAARFVIGIAVCSNVGIVVCVLVGAVVRMMHWSMGRRRSKEYQQE